MFHLPERCQQYEMCFTVPKSGHPMEGCTLAELFIVFKQEMQGFGALGMLSDYFL